MATQHVRVRIRFRWWVRPFIQLARFNASIGIPVDIDRLAEIISKRGVKVAIA